MTLTNLSQVTTSVIATLTDINLNNLTGVAATFTGDVTVGGTLTYDDVTNIDSVGLVTARNGIEIISGDLTIPDSIVHRGDTNTKIRFPANDTFTVETAGTERLRVNLVGDVGIGTIAPHSNAGINLHIHGDNASSELRLTNTTTGGGGNGGILQQSGNTLYLSNTENGNIVLETNGSEKARITSSGLVGIGDNNPDTKLTVKAGSGDQLRLDNAGERYTQISLRNNGTQKAAIWLDETNDDLSLYAAANYHMRFLTGGTESARITSAGNVGINSITPGHKLEVAYTDDNDGFVINHANRGGKWRFATSGSNAELFDIRRYDGANSTFRRYLLFGPDQFSVYTGSTTSSTEKLRIKSDGKVGIGTDNPSELLHLQSGWTKQILKSTNLNTASSLIFDTHNINTADFLLGQLAGKWNGNYVAYINFEAGTDTTNKDDGVITFLTSSASSTPVERMRITNAGALNIGKGDEGDNTANLVEMYVGATNETYGTIRGKYNRSNEFNRSEVRFGVENNGNGLGFLAFATGNNSASERMRITSGGKVGINRTNPSCFLHVAGANYQTLRLENTDNGADGPYIELFNNSDSPADNDYIGIISFKNNNSADEEITYAQIRSQSTDVTDGTEDGVLTFHTRLNGSFGEKLRIDSTGRLLLGTTVEGASTGDQFTISNSGHTGMTIRSATSGEGNIFFSDGTSGDAEYRGIFRYEHNNDAMVFKTAASERLRITSTGDVRLAWGTGTFLGEYYDADYYMGLTFGASSRELFIDNRSNDTRADIVFRTVQAQSAPLERLRIDSAGVAKFQNPTGTIIISSTTGNDGGRIVFRETSIDAWSIDSTRANAPFFIKDEYNNKERFRIDASGKISWNDSSSFMNTTDTMMLQSIASGSTKSMFAIRGGDSGYVHSALRLIATASHNSSGNGRGTGTFYYDEASDVEWFAGRPYSSSDYFIVARNTAVSDNNSGGVTAQHNKSLWYVDNTGATRQKKEQCIYRVEASSHKSSRINTVQGKQGTYSTCTIDFNQASYGSTVYDIKISGYSQAGFHRAGGYYCNSGLYAAFVSLNNQLGSNISHTQAYTNSQTVRQTFTFSSGFVHPVCEVTASTGGDAYFVEGSITITWS